MRDYGKVSPQFWMGRTGKELRKRGPEAQLVALYLMTCPHANMLGLYYVPLMYIAHETGLGMEGASKGLAWAIEAGFCEYDEDSEVVWVVEMAHYQIGERLSPSDKRCAGVQNEYNALPENPYLARFFEKYEADFNLTRKRENGSPLEAPSKPLASQEQEQEQEQEKEQKRVDAPAKPSPASRGSALPKDWEPDDEQIAFCRSTRPDLDPRAVAERFRDYWIAQPGAKGRKSDWPATWRNWVRNEKAVPRAGPAQQSRLDQQKQILDELTGRSRDRSYDPDDPFTIEATARLVG
ncbi:DNA-binding protein [Cupriavidus gilardii]|uniref:DNA-binding protein n=1 Tax=Cupriavidus gilardii TaxID=82541 RepID=UPI00157407C8|nr:DNA-binding protein [Cupriavidus gilardii]NSX05064.1 DNA-binding protein [Cupriavidus gilardii]